MKRIIITGPESSGKTTLASFLAKNLNAPLIPEFAREYLENKGLSYNFNDLVNIAIGQQNLMDNALKKGAPLLICDTDLTVLNIWATERFGRIPAIVNSTLKPNEFDFYLLCKPDLPWVYDPLRENPTDRNRLFNQYQKLLKDLKCNYKIVQGKNEERTKKALSDCLVFLKSE